MVSFLNGFRRSPSALISPCGKLYSKKLSDTVTQVQLLISRIKTRLLSTTSWNY